MTEEKKMTFKEFADKCEAEGYEFKPKKLRFVKMTEMIAVAFQCTNCYNKWICEREDGKRCPKCKDRRVVELWSKLTGVVKE